MDLDWYARIEEARREEERQRAAAVRLLSEATRRQRSRSVYQRILVALQGRESDAVVLDHVQELAAQMQAQIILLRVIGIADDDGGLGHQWQLEVGSSGWRRKKQAAAHLSELEHTLGQTGLGVQTAVVIGTRSEADEIVSYAAEQGCDLIAMAGDPQPWYLRWLGHSPDAGVRRTATVPTLFVGTGPRKMPVRRVVPKANRWMALLGEPEL